METPIAALGISLPKRKRRRFLFPMAVLAIGIGLFLVFTFWSRESSQTWHLVIARSASVALTILFLFLWALFDSGLKKTHVVIGFLGLIVIWMGLFRTRFDSDMVPSIKLRDYLARVFGVSHDDDLERQRAARASHGATIFSMAEQPGDWPEFRGPGRTGVVKGPLLNRDWKQSPPKRLWKQLVGNGWAGFVVVNGHLITIEQLRLDGSEYEAVVCYDAATGAEQWTCKWPGKFDEAAGGPGPRATPTVFEGMVYALGAEGRLTAIDGGIGNERWSREILKDNPNLRWAMAGSPLVFDELVVVQPGTQAESAGGRSLLAFNRFTGDEVWAAGSSPASYSSPMLATLLGERVLLMFDGMGLAAYEPKTGKELFRYEWPTDQGINVAQPIVVGDDQVLIASGYNMGGTLLKVSREGGQWTCEPVWRTRSDTMRCKFSSPVLYNGFIYGLNDGYLECVDLKTGKRKWKDDDRRVRPGGAYGHGQILLCENLLVIVAEYGEIALVEADPEKVKELGRFKGIEGERTWNNPALVNGILYIRNDTEMAAFDLRAKP